MQYEETGDTEKPWEASPGGDRDVREIFKRPKRPVPLDEQIVNVLQLLRDRGSDMTSGPSIKAFEEMGPANGDRLGFTAEYIKRYFGRPKDFEDPESEYVEHLRGASHAVLEKRLRWMKGNAWPLWKALVGVFPRDEGGDRDYEFLQRKVLEGNRDARELLALVEWGIQVLAMRCQYDELFVMFAQARTLREENELKERNAKIGDFYQNQIDSGKRPGSAMMVTRSEFGLSEGRIYQILEQHRLDKGEERRPVGRPRKKKSKG